MPTMLQGSQKANIHNQGAMPHIGHFNDYFRDVIKGKTSESEKYERGYATGNWKMCIRDRSPHTAYHQFLNRLNIVQASLLHHSC